MEKEEERWKKKTRMNLVVLERYWRCQCEFVY